jgi:excisionase family DNA binding protein
MDDLSRRHLWTIPEAAEYLRISRSHLYLLLRSELRSIVIGRRRLITRAALEEFVQRLEAQQDAEPR